MPDGNELVVIDKGDSMVMLRGAIAVAGGDSESLTCTVKFEVPLVAGVPEITPLLAFRVKPAGRLPLMMLQV